MRSTTKGTSIGFENGFDVFPSDPKEGSVFLFTIRIFQGLARQAKAISDFQRCLSFAKAHPHGKKIFPRAPNPRPLDGRVLSLARHRHVCALITMEFLVSSDFRGQIPCFETRTN